MRVTVRTALCCLALSALAGCPDVSPEHPDTGYTFPHLEGFDEPGSHASESSNLTCCSHWKTLVASSGLSGRLSGGQRTTHR